ncbi:MAG: hypothetical protein JO182_07915 [Acidobacteriaceae bacterium]|nr:hypothetical protein [Acidobacteriaceae bacterium]MBV9308641.1 hypothetical protein [Acidobacteriaceae bacterium]MBV9679375.1 hypothetical protein [Acidobacteriaceae bacterium]
MKVKTLIAAGWLCLSVTLGADTLGFVQQKFGDLHFEKSRWNRTAQLPCYIYTALEDGATVDVLRYGMGNLVPLKATKGLRVTVCGDVAAFDEGFEAGTPAPSRNAQKQSP